jgi:hypothetical protein
MNPIPLVDVREGGPLAHARTRVSAAVALRDACLAPLPTWCHGSLGLVDRVASAWLRRSASAYHAELEHIAKILGFHGAVTLNLSYLFACTTSAESDARGTPVLRRSLDWPFNGLGKCVEVAWQAGPAGDFYNATWPGAIGVLTAMAPGRFCAVINQAPMRRRTRGPFFLPYDAAINLKDAFVREDGWPPDHLLRFAFETCANFEEAIALLSREPLARPALFTLTGAKAGEIALVERTQRHATVLRGPVVVANDWQEPRRGWCARMGYENNEARKASLRAFPAGGAPFEWVIPPVLNNTTRLVVEMSAADGGSFLARGYESPSGRDLPIPATADFHLRETRSALAA